MNAKINRLTLLTIAPAALLAIAACGSDDAPASVPGAKSTFEVPAGGTDEIIAQLEVDAEVISVASAPTIPVANLSITHPIANASILAAAVSSDLCVHWQIYKWVDVSQKPVQIAEYYENCDALDPRDTELVPYSLINLENQALRDQLSFIVGRLQWRDYLQLSREYAQLRHNESP